LRLAVDIGGTFTDAVAALDDGSLLVAKIRSTPKTPEDGFLSAISLLVSENKLPPSEVSEIVHVGTIGTNLFLGQAGLQLPKVALIATKGFSDIIEIGRQNRPELYNIFFQRPTPLVQRRLRFEVTERVDSSGRTLQVPSPSDLEDLSRLLKDESVQGVAISFLNSYLNPANELEAKRILQQRLQVPVFASSEVDPEHREYERTSTTVINALLAPTVSAYLRSAMDKLRVAGFTCDMEILSSAGGLVDVEEAKSRPILTIESGPAAGVVGAAELAKLLHIDRMISLDMGGTSAKAGCVVNSLPLVVPEIEVGGKVHMGRAVKGSGYPLRSPCVDLAEVSAGGGTIIWSDETGTLKVGPVSAGAEPGPACYDTGGRNATITDANLVLGRIQEKLLGGKLLLNGARS
jgi:N-methylhydantoinase A